MDDEVTSLESYNTVDNNVNLTKEQLISKGNDTNLIPTIQTYSSEYGEFIKKIVNQYSPVMIRRRNLLDMTMNS